ncbi:hypothetical protein F8306_23465, partial [Salmonella enterica]|nr:hypothetical protein [Salmonella enterica]ECZ7068190.1 hypothetical protein [Salmonella enterica]EJE5329925.1 hypothetical protein [Salmonella enterica]
MKKYVHQKLKFLTYNGYLDVENIFYKLQYAGVLGVYKMYPLFDSRLHLANIYKSSVQNFGCNQIKQHTTQKRQVLHQETDGTSSSRKISIDTLPSPDYIGKTAGSYEDIDNQLGARRIFGNAGPTELKLVKLLRGTYDKGFSRTLGKLGYGRSNITFNQMLQTDPHKFVGLAAQYLGMSRFEAVTRLNKMNFSSFNIYR